MGLPEGVFVFANLNRPFKMERQIFNTWLRILNATADSMLWLFRWPEVPSSVLHLSKQAGAQKSRLVFTDLFDVEQRISGKTCADLFLDTPVYNAHGTATEAISAEVPVLTLPQDGAHASRVAAAVMEALGMSELVARNHPDYEALAIRLASSRPMMYKLKQKLGQQRRVSPLFDKDRWARNVEASYRLMVEAAAAQRVMQVVPHHGMT